MSPTVTLHPAAGGMGLPIPINAVATMIPVVFESLVVAPLISVGVMMVLIFAAHN
jgi:hypothetical protein